MAPRIVFLDTNIFLHYQDFDQLDWLKIVGVDSVLIVIPQVISRELNKHKDTNTNARIKKRANATLQKLVKLVMNPPREVSIRKGVLVKIEVQEPDIDFGAYKLIREVNDDQLVASIVMSQQQHPDIEHVLITSDTGLHLLAKGSALGIITLPLDSAYRLPEEPDAEQVKIKELEKELREFRDRSPRITLSFGNHAEHFKYGLKSPTPWTMNQVSAKIEEIKTQYPKMSRSRADTDDHPFRVGSVGALLAANIFNGISDADIEKYNAGLDKYYEDYRDYLENTLTKYEALKGRSVAFEIWLENNGTAPATDIDIYMHFPDGFQLIDYVRFPPIHKPPSPPSKPQTMSESYIAGTRDPLAYLPYLSPQNNPTPHPPPNVSAPRIKRTNSFEVRLAVAKIKHQTQIRVGMFYAIFHSIADAFSFSVDYELLSADLPKPERDVLHFVNEDDTM